MKEDDLQVGDRVTITVKGRVSNRNYMEDRAEGYRNFVLDGHTGSYGFKPAACTIVRDTFRPGDEVVSKGGGLVRKVIAVHGDKLWLDNGGDIKSLDMIVSETGYRHARTPPT